MSRNREIDLNFCTLLQAAIVIFWSPGPFQAQRAGRSPNPGQPRGTGNCDADQKWWFLPTVGSKGFKAGSSNKPFNRIGLSMVGILLGLFASRSSDFAGANRISLNVSLPCVFAGENHLQPAHVLLTGFGCVAPGCGIFDNRLLRAFTCPTGSYMLCISQICRPFGGVRDQSCNCGPVQQTRAGR